MRKEAWVSYCLREHNSRLWIGKEHFGVADSPLCHAAIVPHERPPPPRFGRGIAVLTVPDGVRLVQACPHQTVVDVRRHAPVAVNAVGAEGNLQHLRGRDLSD
jgi:hypothetical protein